MLQNGFRLRIGTNDAQALVHCSHLWRRYGFDRGMKRTIQPSDIRVLQPADSEKKTRDISGSY